MANIKRFKLAQLTPFFMTKNGVKRIARAKDIDIDSLAQLGKTQAKTLTKTTRQLTQIDHYVICVLLVKNGELNHHDQELLYVAHALSNKWQNCAVLAVVFGNHQQDLAKWGADQVLSFDYDICQHYQVPLMVEVLLSAYEKYQAKHILLADDDWGGGDLLRRLAVAMDKQPASDIIEIDSDQAIRLFDADRQETYCQLPLLLGLKAEVSETELDLICQLSDLNRQQIIDNEQTKVDVYKIPAGDVAVDQANFIMSLGNGVGDVDLFLDCADVLGATVGGSRVVVDDGKLPRERQVGATGKNTIASVYLAFGISGAVQHLEGIKKCQTVIAVNTDESCAMVARAHYSFINDAVEVLAALKNIARKNQEEIS